MTVHALADGQLEGEEKRAAEALLHDPALRSEYEAVLSLKSVVRTKCEPVSSPGTWHKCRERLAEMDKRSVVEDFVGKYAWGLSSIFLALIIGAGLFNRAFSDEGIATSDAARMLSGLASSSSAASEAAPSVDMSEWITPPRGGEIRQVGHASDVFQGHPVAAYYFEDANGRFAVLNVYGVSRVEGVEAMLDRPGYFAGKLNGFNSVAWFERANSLFIVGDRPHEELAKLAERLRRG
jgi:anti-sigma factor RsiW